MKNLSQFRVFKHTKSFMFAHKFISFVMALVLIGGGYWLFFSGGSGTETRYVIGTVERGTIIASVSASGQVSASDEVDVKPKVSGDITWVGVKAGDTVRAGQAIAYIDATDAKQAIADAEQSFAQAKLQYQKDSAQAPIDYEQALEALEDAKKDLVTTYNDTFTTVSDAYLSLPTVMTGMQSLLYGYDLSTNKTQWNVDAIKNIFASSDKEYEAILTIADIAERDYKVAREKYDASLLAYKQLTRYSDGDKLEVSLLDSVSTATSIAQALQSVLNFLDKTVDYYGQRNLTPATAITTMRTNAQTYLSTANSRLSALLAQQKSVDSTKRSIRDQERAIQILKIGNADGTNPISLQSSAYSIADQERNLGEMKSDLAEYAITAPFSGTVAAVNIKRFDSVSSGTAAATVITNQKIAELSLNEVDAAKISLGDKVTLTFDALEELSLTGEVIEIDAVGTVSQGVVSYKIKIGFDSQDERVKSGMTVNASVQTDVRQDVLMVPASAVKTQNEKNYVLVISSESSQTESAQTTVSGIVPEQVEVLTGITDDTNIEILSGLSEGQSIVARTISGTAASTNTSASSNRSGLGSPGMIRF